MILQAAPLLVILAVLGGSEASTGCRNIGLACPGDRADFKCPDNTYDKVCVLRMLPEEDDERDGKWTEQYEVRAVPTAEKISEPTCITDFKKYKELRRSGTDADKTFFEIACKNEDNCTVGLANEKKLKLCKIPSMTCNKQKGHLAPARISMMQFQPVCYVYADLPEGGSQYEFSDEWHVGGVSEGFYANCTVYYENQKRIFCYTDRCDEAFEWKKLGECSYFPTFCNGTSNSMREKEWNAGYRRIMCSVLAQKDPATNKWSITKVSTMKSFLADPVDTCHFKTPLEMSVFCQGNNCDRNMTIETMENLCATTTYISAQPDYVYKPGINWRRYISIFSVGLVCLIAISTLVLCVKKLFCGN